MAQKGLWNLAREKILQDRDALPREEGDAIREYNAIHEWKFLSSWLREDLVGKEKREKEEKREGEKEENASVTVNLGSCGFSWCDLLEDPGDLLDCDPGTRMDGLVVLVVTDVLVSPSSVGTEFCDAC